jgi:hypothetical protein
MTTCLIKSKVNCIQKTRKNGQIHGTNIKEQTSPFLEIFMIPIHLHTDVILTHIIAENSDVFLEYPHNSYKEKLKMQLLVYVNKIIIISP